jgi:hypothetical protein
MRHQPETPEGTPGRRSLSSKTPATQPGKRLNVPTLEMAAAVVALPESRFADYRWYGGWFSSTVLSTTTALLPLIAAAFGKLAPTYEQTQ